MREVPEKIYEIIAKKLAGEANDKELKILEYWLDSAPEAREQYEEFLEIWDYRFFVEKDMKIVSQDETKEKIWEKVFERDKKKENHHLNLTWIAKIAASIIIFVSVVFGFYKATTTIERKKPKIKIFTKQTLPGQKSTITLSDGSTVWLNSNSKISYRSDFNDSVRIINLTGQAYFEVFKDETRPFIVRCNDLEIEALGTSFDVNEFKNNSIQVSLVTGKVKLTANSQYGEEDIILYPGEYSIMDHNDHFVEKGKFDPYEILAWKEGRLIFNNESLDEIIPKLELWYGVKIKKRLSKKTTKRFIGTFERENLDNILFNMGSVMGFEHTIKQNEVIIKN